MNQNDTNQREQWEKQIRRAWAAGVFVSIATILLSIAGIMDFLYGYDAWTLIVDGTLFILLTFGTYKKNRFCALGLASLYVFYIILDWIALGEIDVPLISGVFAYFMIMGTIAAFELHAEMIKNGEKQKRKKTIKHQIGWGVGGLFIGAFVFILTFGTITPEIEVLAGEMVPPKYHRFVKAENLLGEGEEIEYWYSDGLWHISEGVYFFTKSNIVLYSKHKEEPAHIIPLDDVSSIEFYKDDSFLDDSFIFLTLKDGSEESFPLSSEYGGDEMFYEHLYALWSDQQSNEEQEDAHTDPAVQVNA